jgi:hypothetical protein
MSAAPLEVLSILFEKHLGTENETVTVVRHDSVDVTELVEVRQLCFCFTWSL